MGARNKQQRYQDSVSRNVRNWLRFVGNNPWAMARLNKHNALPELKHKLGAKQGDTQFDGQLTAALDHLATIRR